MNRRELLTPLIALALASTALGSGSAPTRPPRPPRGEGNAPAETMDSNRYALGKAVFTGHAQLHSNPLATRQQRARLSQLAARSGKAGASLPNLAGRLSAEQLDAVDYYVSQRYPAH